MPDEGVQTLTGWLYPNRVLGRPVFWWPEEWPAGPRDEARKEEEMVTARVPGVS